MGRVYLRFEPQWEGPILGWAVKYLVVNQWRLHHRFELDDLVQEAYLRFVKCRERYVDTAKCHNARHFMSLFQRILINWITDESKAASRVPESTVDDKVWATQSRRGATLQDLEMNLLLKDAPPVLAILIRQYVEGRLRQRPVYRRVGTRRLRETNNQTLCHLVGLDSRKVNLRQMVVNWLRGEPNSCIA